MGDESESKRNGSATASPTGNGTVCTGTRQEHKETEQRLGCKKNSVSFQGFYKWNFLRRLFQTLVPVFGYLHIMTVISPVKRR